MSEVRYLKYLLKEYKCPPDIQKLTKEFFSLKNENELKEFAKKLQINIDNSNIEEIKEKIAYELIERYFNEKNNLDN